MDPTGAADTGPLGHRLPHKSSVSLGKHETPNECFSQKNFKVPSAFIVTPSKIKTRKTFLKVGVNSGDREHTLLTSVLTLLAYSKKEQS